MYHVWDAQEKKYLRLAQNSYVKLGSIYTTLSGVKEAMKFHAQWPSDIANDQFVRTDYGYIMYHHEQNKSLRDLRDTWWRANKQLPWKELINPRYALHEV